MKLSFSTNAFVNFSVPEAIRSIAGAGYQGVEILADAPHLYPFSTTDSELEKIADLLEKLQIGAANINANTAIGYYGRSFWEPLFEPSLANPVEEARLWRIEYTKKCIDMARFLSCPSVSITSGRMVPGVSPEKSLEFLRQSLYEVLGHASARGVRVGMEYEPGLLVERFEELKMLMDEIGGNDFGANLDLGHSHVLGEKPEDVAAGLGSKIFHVHLEDIRGRKHYHLVPGDGEIDFRAVFRALESISYSGFVTVELYTCPDAPAQAAKRAFDHLDKLISAGSRL